MSGAVDSWPAFSFLEGLRPGPDENVELALLASYSADLGSIGATLLALAGKDTDAGRGSPPISLMRSSGCGGRCVLSSSAVASQKCAGHRASRRCWTSSCAKSISTRRRHSWHPKAALVRTLSVDGEIGWRLWIGSRNLTECVNRDIGLLLISGAKGGAPIPGADELARALADRAALKGLRAASLAATIAKVAWRPPAGVRVERILWSAGLGDQPIPVPPAGTDEVVVVSPFVDKSFLARQIPKGAKPARCVLLTTMREIERIGPTLAAFDDLLALDAPDYPISDPEPDPQSSASDANVGSDEMRKKR